MVASDNAHLNATPEVNPKLIELAEHLAGTWKVKGPGIDGKAEYRSLRGGLILVGNVDFVVNGAEMTNIQHITYDQDTDTLRARYMDTMGDESIYTWMMDGQKVRVIQGDQESDTFFEATFNDDNSEYVGTWHYPDGADDDAADESITYTRID